MLRQAFWRSLMLWPLLAAGCGGPQSILNPAGRGAERIFDLFWWMAAGALIIWFITAGLAVYAIRAQPQKQSRRSAQIWIIGGGAVLPIFVLGILLAYGLAQMPPLLAPAPDNALKIKVLGEQWWWRVRYYPPEGEGWVELANEIRLPVGQVAEFQLLSQDVIHSFWIPSLGGKVDMIPGRRNRLILEPTRTGIFRGVCAEYCGTSHALMAFDVMVMEREAFDGWLEQQRQPARPPLEEIARRGLQVFLSSGCGACHTIRGTPGDGVLGPDLTHVGSRLSLAASTLPNDPDGFEKWIAHPDQVKPDVHMPAFGMLPSDDVRALATYLDSLE